MTAATRLFDVLPVVAGDPRVQIVFTSTGSSAFTAGTEEFLAGHEVAVLPWREALRTRFDLAIAASYGGDLPEIKAPLLVVPHGMGYNKYLEIGNRKSEIGNRKSVFGLSSPWLLHRGELVPSIIVLSHHEQLDRLRLACPEAVGAAVVAGDPCLDRMRASRPLRETYRQALGANPGQRLVVLSSTWGADSLYGQNPLLVRELAARLPFDSYRLAVALHPNIVHGHSRWLVSRWFDDCARAGVLVLPREELWRAALVAADVTIGDHGSVTFYSAALGTPVLLAAAPAGAVDPRSPIGRLLDLAPRFDPARDAAAQLERAVATHDPAAYAPVTDLATARPGASAAVLRRTIYRALDLPEPPHPVDERALPVPEVDTTPPHAQLVRVALRGNGDLAATVTRYAADALRKPPLIPAGAHLVVGTGEPATRLLDLADIVVHDRPRDAGRWITGTLAALPGCALATARDEDGSWLAGTMNGRFVRFDGPRRHGALLASVLHAWLESGRALDELPKRITVHLAHDSFTAHATVC
ncbi:hypothetical protein [Amycolatopsis anabasis]|uniref:hypothetical protein n=1 Tax=Amycolatopsis anabasis TaxID=1840409 RepID=UPI00131E6454|nr:hypothetical protein [Amycolatopsis anabasis]